MPPVSIPADPVFWVRAVLFAAMIASIASYIIINWRKPDDGSLFR